MKTIKNFTNAMKVAEIIESEIANTNKCFAYTYFNGLMNHTVKITIAGNNVHIIDGAIVKELDLEFLPNFILQNKKEINEQLATMQLVNFI